MSDSEKNSFIQFLVSESLKKTQQNDCLQKTIDDLSDRLCGMQLTLDKIERSQHATHAENLKLNAQLSSQGLKYNTMKASATILNWLSKGSNALKNCFLY